MSAVLLVLSLFMLPETNRNRTSQAGVRDMPRVSAFLGRRREFPRLRTRRRAGGDQYLRPI